MSWGAFGAAAGLTGLSGGFDLLGGYLNAGYASAAAGRSYDHQVGLLYLQHMLAMEAASTAHQREVKDLREAGLNPILSAFGGNGASAPVVSAPSVNMAAGQPYSFKGVSSVLANAASFEQAKTSARLADAQIEVAESQQKKNDADASLSKAQSDLVKSQIPKIKAETGVIEDNANRIKLGHLEVSPTRVIPSVKKVGKQVFDDVLLPPVNTYLDYVGNPFVDLTNSAAHAAGKAIESKRIQKSIDNFKKQMRPSRSKRVTPYDEVRSRYPNLNFEDWR